MAFVYAGSTNTNLSTALGSLSAGDIVTLADGAAAYTAGLDLSGVELDTLNVRPSFSGTLGAPGASVIVDLAGTTSYAGDLIYEGTGSFAYFAANTTIARAQILRTGQTGVFLTDGEVSLLETVSGLVSVNDQCDVPVLRNAGASVTIDEYSGQAVDTADLLGGSATISRNIGTATVAQNARLTHVGSASTATTLNVYGYCRVANGTITNLNAYPGSTIDFSGLRAGLTITNSTVWPGVNIIRPPAGVAITYSNATTLVAGGSLLP